MANYSNNDNDEINESNANNYLTKMKIIIEMSMIKTRNIMLIIMIRMEKFKIQMRVKEKT